MGLPSENKAGYDAGNAMAYADKLKGRLAAKKTAAAK